MLYRVGGPHELESGSFDYKIVDKNDEKAFRGALSDAWFETPAEALAYKADALPPKGHTATVNVKPEKDDNFRIPSVKTVRSRV